MRDFFFTVALDFDFVMENSGIILVRRWDGEKKRFSMRYAELSNVNF